MLNSNFKSLGPIALPIWRGRQLHMHAFDALKPMMPEGFEDYLGVVNNLTLRADHSCVAYLTVDEKIVQPGMSQRRPGAHVDGTWMPEIKAHGQTPSRPPGHQHCSLSPPQAIIVAASVAGCIVYPGIFDGTQKDDGDLEHIRPQLGDGVLLPAEQAFLLSPDCVHESVRFMEPTKRTFLRIALEAP